MGHSVLTFPLPLMVVDVTEEVYKSAFWSMSWIRRFIARWTPFFHPDVDLCLQLAADFAFIDQHGFVWLVPKGFRTDYASIPSLLKPAVKETGSWNKATVFHDFFYRSQLFGRSEAGRERADRFLYDVMLLCGADETTAEVYYRAVRVGGKNTYFNRTDDSVRTYCYMWEQAKARIGQKFGPLGAP